MQVSVQQTISFLPLTAAMAFENNKPSLDDPNAWVPYRYYPSVPAAAIFIGLFAIATIAHGGIVTVRRTLSFTPFIVGGACKLINVR
jgi:hypothetical protein